MEGKQYNGMSKNEGVKTYCVVRRKSRYEQFLLLYVSNVLCFTSRFSTKLQTNTLFSSQVIVQNLLKISFLSLTVNNRHFLFYNQNNSERVLGEDRNNGIDENENTEETVPVRKRKKKEEWCKNVNKRLRMEGKIVS
jgi:hypothetical protein